MNKTRVFLAVDSDDALRLRAGGLIDRLRPHAAGARWVEEENLHMTLLFLGDLGDADMAEACSRTDWVCRANRPFTLRVAGVGAFPDPSKPRAVWLGATDGAEALTRLQADLDDALDDLVVRRDNKPFVPHLTLARLGGRSGGPRGPKGGYKGGGGDKQRGPGGASAHLPDVLAGLADYDAGELPVEAVTVFASELRREGPEYHVLARCRLGMGDG